MHHPIPRAAVMPMLNKRDNKMRRVHLSVAQKMESVEKFEKGISPIPC